MMIFVLPIFWFGIESVYSGTPLYDVYLYQLYNTLFTSLPIIWFGIFDQAFEKEELLSNSKHYRIGFRNEDFDKFVFWRWIFYGLWQSCIVLFLCFVCMDRTVEEGGKSGCLYVDGQFVYIAIVVLVNIKILTSTNTHSAP